MERRQENERVRKRERSGGGEEWKRDCDSREMRKDEVSERRIQGQRE